MIRRPIIIVGAPRSGTTILRNCLAQHPDLWHLRAESHGILEGPLHPGPAFDSNRCTASAVTEKEVGALRRAFYQKALNLNVLFEDPSLFFTGNRLLERAALRVSVPVLGALTRVVRTGPIRFLEKTPKNSLRVPLLARMFPDAYFVWNKRAPEDNIDSLVAGWRASDGLGPVERPRYGTYDVAGELDLQDYEGTAWKFALVPEWRSLRGKRVADVAAWQYYQCNRVALQDLEQLDSNRIFEVKHEAFVQDPVPQVRSILEWAELSSAEPVLRFARNLPRINDTRSDPQNDSSLRHPTEVRRAIDDLPALDEVRTRMGYGDSSTV